jgi:hypothetical protein
MGYFVVGMASVVLIALGCVFHEGQLRLERGAQRRHFED